MKHQTLLVVALTALVAMFGNVGPADAATWYVDNSNCPGPGDGSAGNPFCTIQAGIDAAVDGDTIELADGIYTGPGNVQLDFGSKSVTLASANGPTQCILDGQGADRLILSLENQPKTVIGVTFRNGLATFGGAIFVIDNLTIQNCRFENNSADDGGAIGARNNLLVEDSYFTANSADDSGSAISSCNTTIRNCDFVANSGVVVDAGAVGVCNGTSQVVIEESRFTSNTNGSCGSLRAPQVQVRDCFFRSNSGGIKVLANNIEISDCEFLNTDSDTLYADTLNQSSGVTTSILRCIFNGNSGDEIVRADCGIFPGEIIVDDCEFHENLGTALRVSGNCLQPNGCINSATVTDCIFDRNSGSFGGGVRSEINIEIERCSFTGNESTGNNNGGAIRSISNAVAVRECSFEGNSAFQGGAIAVTTPNPNIEVQRCTFIGNTAESKGGAVYLRLSSRGVTSCEFRGNHAGTDGGAVYGYLTGPNAGLSACTLFENTADGAGPAAACDGDFRIDNCIIYNHGLTPLALTGGTHNVRFCDIEHGYVGVGNIDADPLFLDAPNGDLRLQAGSPCIDAGSNGLLPGFALVDLTGNARRVDDPNTADTGAGNSPIVDMGAHEYIGPIEPGCPADLTSSGGGGPDGNVDVFDLFALLSNWNTAGVGADLAPPANIVDVFDLFYLLSRWGPCE